MNWFKLYIGDYQRDTAHLTVTEHGAYRRLLDAYYWRERALPADVRECCKLARAATKPERDAVAYVLREFFSLEEDGYHQARADREIKAYYERKRRIAQFWRSLPATTKIQIAKARREALINATPKWLTQDDAQAIEEVYEAARALSKETGVAHEVDHIVPLRGKTVSGLHVPWNLRAIPAHENRRKGATWL